MLQMLASSFGTADKQPMDACTMHAALLQPQFEKQ
jgi:hypothetical protein